MHLQYQLNDKNSSRSETMDTIEDSNLKGVLEKRKATAKSWACLGENSHISNVLVLYTGGTIGMVNSSGGESLFIYFYLKIR